MQFTYDILTRIPTAEWVLLAVLAVVWLYQLCFWTVCMAAVLHRRCRLREGRVVLPIRRPPVTVVVCARNEGVNLEAYLQMLLTQDYPEYEVIVVNDASEDNTREVVEHYQHRYPNLRMTFVPQEARIRSSKKLALTLAVKAARYDHLLLTDADCRPESVHWIDEMMHGFTDGVEVVLGFGAYFEEPGCLNRLIQYDTLFNGLLYMGRALTGHPYMGVGRNLAYRKNTFFGHKGFAGLLDQRAGDDDLFVNKVATRRNVNVAVTTDSLTWSVPKHRWKDWLQQKARHLSVSPRYKASSKLMLTFEPFTRALFYGMIIAIGCIASWPVQAAAGVLLLTRWLWQSIILTRSAHAFGLRGFGLTVLWYDICLPVLNLLLMLHHKLFRRHIRW